MRQILLLSNSGTIALRFLCVFLAALSCHGAVAQTPTANYVKTETMLTGNGSQKQTSLQRGDDTPAATYTHNIRGWLKNLNDVGFWERILYTYNEIIDGGDSYTGNIGNLMWRNQNDTIDHNYCFYYDGEGRLDGAYYSAGEDWTEDMDRYNLKINSYDLNGNILSLKRNGRKSDGSYGLTDDLTMSYSGNRLIRVVDAADPVVTNGSMDFKDGTDTGVEYTYNASGALTSDLNKGISGIDYDINGNMSKVTFFNGNTTEYVYSQSGAKQRVIHGTVTALPFAEPGISTAAAASVSRDTTEYIGDFVFRNGVLDRLLFRGGYMDIAGGVPRYHYFATDHLGSVRTVYGEDGVAEQLLTYDLFGGIIPELSTGMGMQPYGYNGKELDHTHGLDWYDYGARYYDSPIGRWTTMDPLCEKYYNVSPYVYCGNNPMNAVDMDGRDYWSTNDMNQIINFINAIGRGQNQFDFSDWQHATDAEITGRLTYNDETGKFYTSYAEFSNGEIVVTGKSFDANLKPVSASGYGYPGAFVYEPLEGFWLNLNHILNGTIYYDGFINWNVNTEGRINGVVPITGTAPTFGKGNKFVGGKQKMGHSLGKMTRDHDRQNKQVRSLAKKYKLSEKETDVLHDEISHQGFGYHEIEEFIHDFFGK